MNSWSSCRRRESSSVEAGRRHAPGTKSQLQKTTCLPASFASLVIHGADRGARLAVTLLSERPCPGKREAEPSSATPERHVRSVDRR